MKLRFKYGLQMLLRNPVRIAASLLAAIIALGIAGMCIFTLCYSAVDWERDLYFNHSDDKYTNIVIKVNAENGAGVYDRMSYDTYSALEQDIKEIGGGYATELTMSYAFTYDIQGRATTSWAYGVSNLPNYFADTSAGTTIFSEYEGETLFAPHLGNWTGSSCVQGSVDALIFDNVYAQMTVYSGEDAMEAFGYTLAGSLPEKDNEVAVPQWLYNCFLCYGYRDADGTAYEINSEADLIGKELALIETEEQEVWVDGALVKVTHISKEVPATIVGVVHTDLQADGFFDNYLLSTPEDNVWNGYNDFSYSNPPHLGIIYSKAYLEKVIEMRGSFDPLKIKCISVPRFGEHGQEYFDYVTAWKQNRSVFWIKGNDARNQELPSYILPRIIFGFYGYLGYVFDTITIYFQIVPYLGAFAAILLMYLCFSTVMGKRRGVGIMQSMGASKWQMTVTIGVPILLFCLVCSLGALCVEVGFLTYMNDFYEEVILLELNRWDTTIQTLVYPFTLGWQTWLFTFGVPLLIAAVTTLVTVWLVFRALVVDNLNKKDFRLFRKKVKINPFTDLPWSSS